jgi:hypothetical protein
MTDGTDSRTSEMSSVLVADIVNGEVVPVCAHCNDYITATEDENGIWVECPCDCGYVHSIKILAIVM